MAALEHRAAEADSLGLEGEQREAAELREYAARSDANVSHAFGALADKLRSALDSRRR